MDFAKASQSAHGYFELALELTRKKNLVMAEIQLRNGVKEFPNDAKLHNMLGNNLRRKTDRVDDHEALFHLREACRLQPYIIRYGVDHAVFRGKIAFREEKPHDLYEAKRTLLSLFKPEEKNITTTTYILTDLGSFFLNVKNFHLPAQCFGKCLEWNEGDQLARRRLHELDKNHSCHYSNEG